MCYSAGPRHGGFKSEVPMLTTWTYSCYYLTWWQYSKLLPTPPPTHTHRLGQGGEWGGTQGILPGSNIFPFCCSSNHEFSRRSLPAGSKTKVRPQSLFVLVWDVAFPANGGEWGKADAHQIPCPSTEISKVLVWPIPCRGKNSLGWKKITTSTIFIHVSKIKHPDSICTANPQIEYRRDPRSCDILRTFRSLLRTLLGLRGCILYSLIISSRTWSLQFSGRILF